ncbi:hypothetical protein [Thioalkalivibrio sp. ALJ21]|nr:hypothetical protein [Thioalkalivibrio sp. ALJ21]
MTEASIKKRKTTLSVALLLILLLVLASAAAVYFTSGSLLSAAIATSVVPMMMVGGSLARLIRSLQPARKEADLSAIAVMRDEDPAVRAYLDLIAEEGRAPCSFEVESLVSAYFFRRSIRASALGESVPPRDVAL